jgi:hypothetical protein
MAKQETEALVYSPEFVVTCEGCMCKVPLEFALPSGDEPGYNCPKCVLLAVDHQYGQQGKRYEGFVHALVKFRTDPRPLARLLFVPETVGLACDALEALAASIQTRELDARTPDCVGCLMGSPLAKLHTCAKTPTTMKEAEAWFDPEEIRVHNDGTDDSGEAIALRDAMFLELAEWRRSGCQTKKLDLPVKAVHSSEKKEG